MSKFFNEKHFHLLFIGEEGKIYYVLIKAFNTFMYDYLLHHGRKHFCRYCLQAFSTEKILICYVKESFQAIGNQMINMAK